MPDKPNPKAPVALSPSNHKGLKIKQNGNVDYLKSVHAAKVYAPEYTNAAIDYPIVFIKDAQSNEFFSVLIWGTTPGENLYVENSKWVGGFVPASVRCFPFSMSKNPDNADSLLVGIFEDSELINKDEGSLMFNDDGTDTEWMGSIKKFLVQVYEQEQLTLLLAKKLDSLDLLIPQTISFQAPEGGEEKKLDGFYIVDRKKLAELPEKDFMELGRQGALEAIYAHLLSLNTLQKLVKKKYDPK